MYVYTEYNLEKKKEFKEILTAAKAHEK